MDEISTQTHEIKGPAGYGLLHLVFNRQPSESVDMPVIPSWNIEKSCRSRVGVGGLACECACVLYDKIW